ncbi:CoA ester lyase [Homoserinimonas sp. OAct 916]|uniref:HpcH/HpaI aldolase/citrate lyase family protein n=1 Tax=Homoserinimonas sp. OAct 916 TaxID=2211450 RepID=UPI000DBE5164|nr:CoA ester lyase [Homoserinimonas sp. OAct 916]
MSGVSLPRSYLYVPGNAPEKLSKALTRGADALILDLEDAVPMTEKDNARSTVVRWLREQPADLATELWVRINPGPLLLTDAGALANIPTLTGLVIAKCEGPGDVSAVADLLTARGDIGTLLMPLIETARAVLAAPAIAEGPRVHQLQIGEVDLGADTGIEPGADEAELGGIRSMIVLASAAAQINPPLGPVSRLTSDPESLLASTERVRRQGFVGRACIHPAQIPVVHDVFTPTEEEIAEAESVLEVFAEAEAEGSGVVLDSAGRLIDLAVLRGARKTLALADRPRR